MLFDTPYLTALIQVEGDTSGADGWRPLSTIVSPVPLLVAFLPPGTAPCAVAATAAPLSVICAKS